MSDEIVPLPSNIVVCDLGLSDYSAVWQKMRAFTDDRTDDPDQLWVVEHPAVFTQGQAGKSEHVLGSSDIPLVQTDRGGQVTYHGPGQLVVYPLLNLRRKGLGVRDLVTLIEQSVVRCLAQLGVESQAKPDAPGVYVAGRKIASLGLRVRKGCSYHGVSLNIDMDLSPFNQINPCGYPGLSMVQLRDLLPGQVGLVSRIKKLYIKSLLSALNCRVEK